MGPIRTKTFSGAGTMFLGCARSGSVCRWAVHIEDQGSWSGSVTPQARSVGDGALTPRNIAFYDVEAGAMTTTAPTADAIILVESTGMDVELDVTAAAGSVKIVAVPVLG